MPERSSYAPGTPSWVDLGSPDVGEANAFYSGVFGWDVDAMDDPEAGGYGMYRLRGRSVAGFGPAQNPGPPFWSVYVTVADVDAATELVGPAGGTVVVPPMDVMTAGRMAVYQDPNGSFISAWQAGETAGVELVNEPGAFVWNELATPDLAAADAFYQAVFGWGRADTSSDTASHYTVDDAVVCGAHTAGEGEPPFWSVWFMVDDCQATLDRATGLGGTTVLEPNDMGWGIGAMVADPHGAVFGFGSMAAESTEG